MAVPPAAWEGGAREFAMLQAAMSDAAIVCHAPPDFPFNAEILGVCAVSAENADQNKYGWMVADFLHWKLLFYGVGAKAAQVSDTPDQLLVSYAYRRLHLDRRGSARSTFPASWPVWMAST
jgi:hypothetical protein